MVLQPLRKGLNANEKIFTGSYKQTSLAKTYPVKDAVAVPRINGNVGIQNELVQDWSLKINRIKGGPVNISIDEIKNLPKTEIVFDFKCIEGWSQITHWGGILLSDLLELLSMKTEMSMNYVGLSTPDSQYYVGIDMDSALHPQTLLCYEMNDKPLTEEHGAPLRLIIPVKYGVKHLKRIGSIYFANERPPDYWAERGYDYYCGH